MDAARLAAGALLMVALAGCSGPAPDGWHVRAFRVDPAVSSEGATLLRDTWQPALNLTVEEAGNLEVQAERVLAQPGAAALNVTLGPCNGDLSIQDADQHTLLARHRDGLAAPVWLTVPGDHAHLSLLLLFGAGAAHCRLGFAWTAASS